MPLIQDEGTVEISQAAESPAVPVTPKSIRVLIATPLYPPESGGPATYAKALEEGLPAHDVHVTLLAFSEVRQYSKFVKHFVYFWKTFKLARGVDVVLALDPVSVGLPALCAAFLARKKFIVKIVGDYAWEQGRQRFRIWLPLDEFVRTKEVPLPVLGLRLVQTFVARSASRIIVPSEYLRGIVQTWGIAEEHISVIYNAVPGDVPGTLPELVEATPHPRIVSVGRLVPWKGMHGLISALPKIRKTHPSAQIIIVGEGPDREQLERFAQARLGEGVLFTGALSHPETLAVIDDSDVLVLNSSYEGLSHLLIEALSLGCAIVATKAGGNSELITNESNGLLISVGDPEGLAHACNRLIDDKELRTKLTTEAKSSSERFLPERMLLATAQLLRTV